VAGELQTAASLLQQVGSTRVLRLRQRLPLRRRRVEAKLWVLGVLVLRFRCVGRPTVVRLLRLVAFTPGHLQRPSLLEKGRRVVWGLRVRTLLCVGRSTASRVVLLRPHVLQARTGVRDAL
jgi:hypothetical protein